MPEMLFFFSSRRRHTRFDCDWSSDVCSSDLSDLGLHSNLPFGAPESFVNNSPNRCNAAASTSIESVQRPSWGSLLFKFMMNCSRSEERRVGKECRSGWAAYYLNNNQLDVICRRCCFFFQAEDGIRDLTVTGVQTCALPIFRTWGSIRTFRSGLQRAS